jgi:proteic killer suppression protein
MIKTFKHKGLERFFNSGSARGIQANHTNKLRMQLVVLDTAQSIEDLDIPGYRLHPLKGNKQGIWSIAVSGNWRVTFEFKDGNAHIVNYEDYH